MGTAQDRRPATETARVFVGLRVAPEIAQELAQRARSVSDPTTRLVPSEDLHLTLLPPWDEVPIAQTIERLRAASRGLEPFTLTFTRLSYWPNRHRPRLLCAECVPTHEISTLQSALLHAFGQKEDKPFQPHVTLARMQRGRRAPIEKTLSEQPLSLAQCVRSVELFQSPRKERKGYEVLASVPLARFRSTWRNLVGRGVVSTRNLWRTLRRRVASLQRPSKGASFRNFSSWSRFKIGRLRCCNS